MRKKTVLIGLDAAVPTLVDKYVAEGHMPNLKRLLERGTYSRLHSTVPGITPVAWASVSTGAYPGTHGITDFMLLDEGEPLDSGRNAFLGNELRAETIWEAAEKAGIKTAAINFPQAWPPEGRSTYWVAGFGSPATGSPFEIRSSSCFATPAMAADLRDATVVEWQGDSLTFALIPFKDPQGSGPVIRLEKTAGGLRLTGPDGSAHSLTAGQWTPWFTAIFVEKGERLTGTFRFKLIRRSADGAGFSLYCSQVMAVERMAVPTDLGVELVERFGPYVENSGARGYERNWVDLETFSEESEHKARWIARAANYLLTERGVDLLVLKWHFLDHIQHLIWGRVDPISPWYHAETAPFFEAALIRAYRAADELIGAFLPLLDDGHVVAMVSDHGHTPHLKAMSVNNLLAEKGYLKFTPAEPRPKVHWNETRFFGGPCCGHIRVNLKGRDPEGIVDPADYERAQEEIIEVLLSYRDPETGMRPVAMAVKKREAKVFGQWGTRTGDVIFLMREGYTGDFNWSPLSADGVVLVPMSEGLKVTADYGQYKWIASKFQSAHGCGLPTAELGLGTDECVFVIAGPGVRGGYHRPHSGHVVDVAPTLAHFGELPCPKQAEGNILGDISARNE